jgi:hypothetical protein
MLYSAHDIDNCELEDAMGVLPHLDPIERIDHPIQGEDAQNIIVSIATCIIDHVGGKKCAPNVGIVEIIKLAITLPMVTALTLMKAVDTAAKLVTLHTIIDHKQQGTNIVNNNPPATNFQLNLLKTRIISSLPLAKPLKITSMML